MAHVTSVKSEVIPFGQLEAAEAPPVEPPPLKRSAPLFDEAECHACAPTPREEAEVVLASESISVSVFVGIAICAVVAYAYYRAS